MSYKVHSDIPFASEPITTINGYDICVPQIYLTIFEQTPKTGNLNNFPIWIKLSKSYRCIVVTCVKSEVYSEVEKYLNSPYFLV